MATSMVPDVQSRPAAREPSEASGLARGSIARLLVPREHGSWALWVLPLMSGAVVGLASGKSGSPWLSAVAWFCLATTSAFLAHQPLEALLGRSLLKAHSTPERRVALLWTVVFLALSALGVVRLVLEGRALVLLFAMVALGSFVAKILLGKVRLSRAASQIIGALGLSSTAAGAYYIVAGRVDVRACLLWLASWLFAAAQIEYVQLRLQSISARSRRDKARAGWKVCLLHLALLTAAMIAALSGQIPALLALAFVPAGVRFAFWAAGRPRRLRIHLLGVSELLQNLLFNCLLATALILPR